jgi:tRNA (guanine-N7-)-methyltransferase
VSGFFAPDAPPLEVDFGCHRGSFLLAAAEAFPERNFLGIERQSSRVERCNAGIARLGLANALVVRGEGVPALQALPEARVEVLHVSFPDPWPKRRHAGRRLVSREFLAEAARVLRPQGSLRLMTDSADYFSLMRRLTAGMWCEDAWDDGIARPPTTFEKTFLRLGVEPFRLALRKPPFQISA